MVKIKKMPFLIILFICLIWVSLCLSLWWLLPAKRCIEEGSYSQYYDGENVVLLCTGSQSTAPFWEIIEAYGVEAEKANISIVGYTPEKVLKKPLHNYMENQFVFIGTFSEYDNTVFISESWHIVGEIKRSDAILPYPKKHLSWSEIMIK